MSPAALPDERATRFFEGPEGFEAWLEEHGDGADELWIRMAKKGTGIASLDWTRAVDVALCFGWIDGQSRRVDDAWFLQRFTPRRRRSLWSKVNREMGEALTAAFAALSSQNRYAVLHRVQTAKRPETRARRIAKYVGMLAAGETPHP